MKNPLLLLVFIISGFFCQAQENAKAKPPVIVEKVYQGEQITNGNYTVCFEKVIVDSRCPSDVTCIRAGEAKILINITKDGTTKSKTIEVPNSPKQVKNSVEMGEVTLEVYGLQPYPTSKSIGKEKKYYLQVKFKTP